MSEIKKIKFGENGILYGCDFSVLRGIPTNITFKLRKSGCDLYELRGSGFGDKKNYGNGCIMANAKDIEKYLEDKNDK